LGKRRLVACHYCNFSTINFREVLANKQGIDCERLNDMSGDNISDNDLLKDTFLMAVTADHESLIRFSRAV
jgi:hypothetical protein